MADNTFDALKKAFEANSITLEEHSSQLASILRILGTITDRLQSTLTDTTRAGSLLGKVNEFVGPLEEVKNNLLQSTRSKTQQYGIASSSSRIPPNHAQLEVLRPLLDKLEVLQRRSEALKKKRVLLCWQRICDRRALNALDGGLRWALEELRGRLPDILVSGELVQTRSDIPSAQQSNPSPVSSNSPQGVDIPVLNLNLTPEVTPTVDVLVDPQRLRPDSSHPLGGAPLGLPRTPTPSSVTTSNSGDGLMHSSSSVPNASSAGDLNSQVSGEDVLDRLPHLDADFRAAINANKRDYLANTRAELFSKLDAWAQGLDAHRMCVLSGAAGTGKSTIAFEFAQRLDNNGHPSASFFFLRGEKGYNTPTLFFPTLSVQLARVPSLRNCIIEGAWKHRARGGKQQLQLQAQDLLLYPLSSLTTHQPQKPIVIIVDALDECVQNELDLVPRMIEYLVALTRIETCHIRIFLTTRPDLTIEDTLRRLQVKNYLSLHEVTRKCIDRDITKYLERGLDTISPDPPERKHEIVHHLTIQAEGLFMYARTVAGFLKLNSSDLPEQLNVLFSDTPSVHGALERLDEMYLTALKTAFPVLSTSRVETNRARLKRVLGLIAVLCDLSPMSIVPTTTPLVRGDLSPRVLAALVGPELPSEDSVYVLNRLRSVIVYERDNYDAKFSPIHSSFCTFLVDPHRCQEPLYQVDAMEENARLASYCLRLLTTDLTGQFMVQIFPERPRKADVFVIDRRLRGNVPIALQYACVHWATHLIKGRQDTEVMRLLEEFVGSKLLEWFELLGYMGGLNVAAPSLRDAKSIFPNQIITLSLLDKALKLVESHYARINECPSIVYTLGSELVPASPTDTLISTSTSVVSPPSSPSNPDPLTPRSPGEVVQSRSDLPTSTKLHMISPRLPKRVETVASADFHSEPGETIPEKPPGESSIGGARPPVVSRPKVPHKEDRSRIIPLPTGSPKGKAEGPLLKAQSVEMDPIAKQNPGSVLEGAGQPPEDNLETSNLRPVEVPFMNSARDTDHLSVLKAAFPGKHREKLPASVRSILGCIALLQESLSPRALVPLTGIQIHNITSILDRLHSVVQYSREDLDNKVQLLDPDFTQYILDPNRCKQLRYLVDTKQQHTSLATKCLEALASLRRNICELEDPKMSRADVRDLAERVRAHVPEHVQYACVYWGKHLAEADPGSTFLTDALSTFAFGDFTLKWLETLGYMGGLDIASTMLMDADTWLEKHEAALTIFYNRKQSGQAVDIRRLLARTRHLVVLHRQEIDACPNDVYYASIGEGS